MNRDEQIALMESVEARLNELADRVMNEPIIRESVTRRADEKHASEYRHETLHVRYG